MTIRNKLLVSTLSVIFLGFLLLGGAVYNSVKSTLTKHNKLISESTLSSVVASLKKVDAGKLSLQDFSDIIFETDSSSYPFVLTSDHKVLAYIDRTKEGQYVVFKDLVEKVSILSLMLGQTEGSFSYYYTKPGGADDYFIKDAVFRYYAPLDAYVVYSTYRDESNKEIYSVIFPIIVLLIISFIVIAVTIIYSTTKTTKSLSQASNEAYNILSVDANLAHRIAYSKKDELGSLIGIVNKFIETLQLLVKQVVSSVDDVISSQDVLAANTVETSATVYEISQNAKGVESLMHSLKDLNISSRSSILGVVDNLKNLVDLITDNSSAIDEISANTREMLSSTMDISGVVSKESKEMLKLKELVILGEKQIQENSRLVSSVVAKADTIFSIVDTLFKLSQRTNILAMNAAIEAAHAGNVGKGFAVVAEEIRKLADFSKDNSKTIGVTLKTIVNDIHAIESSEKSSSKIFHEIRTSSENSSKAFNMIDNGLQETSASTSEIANAIKDLRDMSYTLLENIQTLNDNLNASVKDIDKATVQSEEVANAMTEVAIGTNEITTSVKVIEDTLLDLNTVSSSLNETINKFKI